MKNLFLCAQPRSGTDFFLELLCNHGPNRQRFLSLNESLYHPRIKINKIQQILGDNAHRYCLFKCTPPSRIAEINEAFDFDLCLDALRQCRLQHTDDGYLVYKWFLHGFKRFIREMLELPEEEAIPPDQAARGLSQHFEAIHYLYLFRQNMVLQAISLYIAYQTGQWHIWKSDRNPGNPAPVAYDYEGIARHYRALKSGDGWWERFFREGGIQPLRITYEELCKSYPTVLTWLADMLGTEIFIPDPDAISLVKQADERNEEFYQRFMEDMAKDPQFSPQ